MTFLDVIKQAGWIAYDHYGRFISETHQKELFQKVTEISLAQTDFHPAVPAGFIS